MRLSVVAAFLVLVAARPASVDACGNPVYLSTDKATKLVAAAERALDDGQPKSALRVLRDVENYGVRLPGELQRRAQLLLWVAHMRVGDGHASGATEKLRRAYEQDKTPWTGARYAEALARGEDTRDEALAILADLEQRDLMPDAHAWATLAILRDAAGDAEGRDRAAEKCRTAAKKAAICPFAKAKKKK